MLVTVQRIDDEDMPLALLLIEDVTERRKVERRKDDFLMTLAHELKNPLASIHTALQLLKMGREGVQRGWAEEVIGRQVTNLSRLVEDLMDVSRISRGKVRLRKEPSSLVPIVYRAVESVRPLMVGRSQQLQVAVATGPLDLEANPMRLEQVLVNLLTNASKYGAESGLISLSARREAGEIVITVKDDGQGIPPDMLPYIFGMFTQVEGSLHSSMGGLGIGLAVVHQLVALHGGSVSAASDGPGLGSEFTVRTPGRRATPGQSADRITPPFRHDAFDPTSRLD